MIVLDTNVLVSGMLKPGSPPAQLVRFIAAGKIQLAYDLRVLGEYRRVLSRKKFGIDPWALRMLLEKIVMDGQSIVAPPLNIVLPDPDDLVFVEVAHAAHVEALVTGNARHFPRPLLRTLGVHVLSPTAYLRGLLV